MSKKKKVQLRVVWPDIVGMVEELAAKAKNNMLPTDKEIEAEARSRAPNEPMSDIDFISAFCQGAHYVMDKVDDSKKRVLKAAEDVYPDRTCKVCNEDMNMYGGCKCNGYTYAGNTNNTNKEAI